MTSSHPHRDHAHDRDLIARIRDGDATAFRDLYCAFHTRLLEFACSVVNDRDDAKDVVQDVFAALWARRHELVIGDRADVYLYRAIRNRAIDVMRKERHRVSLGTVTEEMPDAESAYATPEQTVYAQQLDVALDRAVRLLPPAQRDAILLHWRHGLPNPEIATVMERSVGAVAVYLSRARETLRATLDLMDGPPSA